MQQNLITPCLTVWTYTASSINGGSENVPLPYPDAKFERGDPPAEPTRLLEELFPETASFAILHCLCLSCAPFALKYFPIHNTVMKPTRNPTNITALERKKRIDTVRSGRSAAVHYSHATGDTAIDVSTEPNVFWSDLV